MNANYRLKTVGTLLILALLSAGCAAREAYKRGTQAEVAKDYETAMEQYRQALAQDPGNIEYRLKFEQTRFTAAYNHFEMGRRAVNRGDLATAKAEFQRAAEIDPTHEFAQVELANVEKLIEAQNQNAPKPPVTFGQMVEATKTNPNLGSQLKTTLTDRISLLRMSASNRTVFQNLASQAGLQVIFGRNYREANVTIELQDVNIFEALDLVSLQTASFWQPVNENTIMVMEDTTQNRRDFEDQIYKTIYLENVTNTNDLNQIMNVLRTAFSLRGVYPFEPGNAIVIRDTPARVALVESVVRALDKARAEVVIEATVMEVDRSVLRDLGILPPGDTSITFNSPTVGATDNSVRLNDLDRVGAGSFSLSVPASVANFVASGGRAKLLQNPTIRTTDNQTASLRVGSEVPVPTTQFQSTNIGGGATTSYQLQQVGVQMDILPRVLPNRDVSMSVTVTVRSLAGDRQVGDLVIPVFGNRVVAHTIRLAEGETNILGGIISDTESVSMTGIPGLKDIPILKYLFASERKTRDEAEIIIMLTPHIVRMPQITEDDLKGLTIIGGDTNPRLRPDYDALPALPTPPAAPTPATPTPTAPIPPPPAGDNGALLQEATPTTATVAFAAGPVTLSRDRQTPVNVSISGPNILGTDITLSFDPKAFSVKDVYDGGFLSRDGQIIALVHNIDNQRGKVTVSLERAPNAPVVSGDGTLLTLLLEPGAQAGVSPLRVTEFDVRDSRSGLHRGGPAEVQINVP